MTSRPPTSPAAPAPAGRSAALRHQTPGPPARALPRHHSATLAQPATLRLALRKPAPAPIMPTGSATLRLADFRQNQFGGTLGGPIVKNQTFFFGDIQWTRLRRGRTDNVRTIDPPERTGDFSNNPNRIFDPFTNRTLPDGNTTRDPFVGNIVPPSVMSDVAQRVVTLYPQPNSSGAQNFVGNSVLQSNVVQYDIRLNHRFSDSDSFFWRGSISNQDHINPGSFETVASGRFRFPSTGSTPGRGIASGWTHSWSPKVVSDVRFGFARLAWLGDIATPDRYSASELGIPGVPEGPQQVGLPAFSVAGLEYLGDQGLLPVVRGKNVFNYLANVTITEGRHSFKAGFDMRATQFNVNQPGGPRGNWTFNGVFTNQPNAPSGTGSGVADLLLGYAQNASIANSQTVGTRIRQYNWFFLDDWKATDRLTINWGLRYELTTPPYEAFDRALSFDFDRGEIVFARPGSWCDRAFTDLAKNNFAPRLGLAYQLTDSSVVRAGYGIFWAFEDNGTFLPMFNFPFRFSAGFPSDQVNPSSALRLDTGSPPERADRVRACGARPADTGFQSSTRVHPAMELHSGASMGRCAFVRRLCRQQGDAFGAAGYAQQPVARPRTPEPAAAVSQVQHHAHRREF